MIIYGDTSSVTLNAGVTQETQSKHPAMELPAGLFAADHAARIAASASHPRLDWQSRAPSRARQALAVRSCNCERLLSSCLDVAEGWKTDLRSLHADDQACRPESAGSPRREAVTERGGLQTVPSTRP